MHAWCSLLPVRALLEKDGVYRESAKQQAGFRGVRLGAAPKGSDLHNRVFTMAPRTAPTKCCTAELCSHASKISALLAHPACVRQHGSLRGWLVVGATIQRINGPRACGGWVAAGRREITEALT
jgi:hypothetical protein